MSTPSETCGGTAHFLPAERKLASFDVESLRKIIAVFTLLAF
jgi:hypothetical protein